MRILILAATAAFAFGSVADAATQCKDPNTGKFIACPKPTPSAHAAATSAEAQASASTSAAKANEAAAKKDASTAKAAASKAQADTNKANAAADKAKAAGAPAGATAKCKDGSYSMSKTHTGSCSHHGGVATFLK